MAFAAFGALTIEALNMMDLRSKAKQDRPDFRDWLYWLPFFGLPIIGGVLALAYEWSDISLTPILALNVGAAAPVTFRSFASGAAP